MENNLTANERKVIATRPNAEAQAIKEVKVRKARKSQKEESMMQNPKQQHAASTLAPAQLTPALEKMCSIHQPSQTKRKKRRSKVEMEDLQKKLLILLKAGYSLSSAPYILQQRKDNIGNRLMNEAMLSQLGNFSQEKRVMPSTPALSKLLGLHNTPFIEITRNPSGGIHIVEASVEKIRRQLGICD